MVVSGRCIVRNLNHTFSTVFNRKKSSYLFKLSIVKQIKKVLELEIRQVVTISNSHTPPAKQSLVEKLRSQIVFAH